MGQFNTLVHPRTSRSGRRSRRFPSYPLFIRNNLDHNPSNTRTHNRRVRFSSTNRNFNDSVRVLKYTCILVLLNLDYKTLVLECFVHLICINILITWFVFTGRT